MPSENAGGAFGYADRAGPNALTAIGKHKIEYDHRGRVTDDGDRTYSWNGVDRLTTWNTKTATESIPRSTLKVTDAFESKWTTLAPSTPHTSSMPGVRSKMASWYAAWCTGTNASVGEQMMASSDVPSALQMVGSEPSASEVLARRMPELLQLSKVELL